MRRVLVAGCSLVILALAGLLAAGVGARTVGSAPTATVQASPAASHRARPRIVTPHIPLPLTGGSTCFVSVPRCSQTPCVELIGFAPSDSVATVVAVGRAVVVPPPSIPRRLPTKSCRSPRTVVPNATLKTLSPSARPPARALAPALLPRLKAMAAQLAAHRP